MWLLLLQGGSPSHAQYFPSPQAVYTVMNIRRYVWMCIFIAFVGRIDGKLLKWISLNVNLLIRQSVPQYERFRSTFSASQARIEIFQLRAYFNPRNQPHFVLCSRHLFACTHMFCSFCSLHIPFRCRCHRRHRHEWGKPKLGKRLITFKKHFFIYSRTHTLVL